MDDEDYREMKNDEEFNKEIKNQNFNKKNVGTMFALYFQHIDYLSRTEKVRQFTKTTDTADAVTNFLLPPTPILHTL